MKVRAAQASNRRTNQTQSQCPARLPVCPTSPERHRAPPAVATPVMLNPGAARIRGYAGRLELYRHRPTGSDRADCSGVL